MNQIAGLSSMATRQILSDLAESYEHRSGCSVAFMSVGGVEAERRIRTSEAVDVVILASKVMEKLEAEGHVLSGSRVDFARSGMAVAVRSGAERPSIKNEAAVKEAILAARAICYSTGPSGDHVKRLRDRWASQTGSRKERYRHPQACLLAQSLRVVRPTSAFSNSAN